MRSFDPMIFAKEQIARDEARTRHMPALFARKVARMRASAVGFLRGAAPLFYELYEHYAEDCHDGPAGEGWIAGDLHVENFGVYRTAPVDLLQRGRAANVTFDLNDFDDALVGPWRLDVLRLLTSLLLAARGFGASGARAASWTEALLDAYTTRAFDRAPPPLEVPVPVMNLLTRASARTRRALLDARTTRTSRGRRFVRDGLRYAELPPATDAAARKVFQTYAHGVRETYGLTPEHFEVLDAAFRIAGTGSLGTLRIAVLARGKGKDDGNWIFDMKAQSAPSAEAYGKPAHVRSPAERVLTAMQRCLEQPPHMAGTVPMKLGGKTSSMLVRRLAPQEDKLDLGHVPDADLLPLARYLGGLTGAAHRRGAQSKPRRPWSSADCTRLLFRAFALAGLHEAIYLAYSRLTEPLIAK
ncbi:DUF2252 domain-containing protein [Pendulispora rubella]|uniref:DUF2252 domain-containing protein n=1 Tax=Pendulispora rubella TaxID=2741070 RepID=A0ABZ2LL48_9BACT